jgi:hypothetical protein
VAAGARQVVSFQKTLDPDPETHSQYRELYEKWTRVYNSQLAPVEEGLLKPFVETCRNLRLASTDRQLSSGGLRARVIFIVAQRD